jgi:hypothetical protein
MFKHRQRYSKVGEVSTYTNALFGSVSDFGAREGGDATGRN